MSRQFILAERSRYPWIFLILATMANTLVYFSASVPKNVELLVPTTGVVAAFVYFLYSQHLQETRLFVELFQRFNERYDGLNDKLNSIAGRENKSMLSQQERQTLFDYFNLCAEEYLYFKTGYIDCEVWLSWVDGMRFFSEFPDIGRLWADELKSGSYYGFTLALLNANVRPKNRGGEATFASSAKPL